ncbi:family 43 glycosylhydrolase [Phycicoccus sp. Soil803]|uniref:family 43 glycosylhydrolase n=1 Tax=Phycicoccus sp. Soil803 TaxID=1736415 RepID=UPI0007096601|nr:family 43 glycosylhydrolase [Phycicoccus sp. Soil803]KRF21821.1 hypothetical protein ASG95_20540 [Phycicoccus sp. Soil803]
MCAIVCNPVDLPYRYQDVRSGSPVEDTGLPAMTRSVYREGADPSVVLFRGRFFMFVSMSRGFWHSVDLVTWEYFPTDKLPALDYAPDVREVDGALFISASRRDDPCPFFRSTDPLADDFEEVTPGTFPFWDPNLFCDHDGRTYLYWGCDNITPIFGVELDPATFEARTEPVALVWADTSTHGWEQTGEDRVIGEPSNQFERITRDRYGTDPFVEGAWMTHHEGRYYLQYAAPGTEFNTYADGYYTSASPLGPFSYDPHSPFSLKPGGFITGAGHGSTFQDRHGNWWHAATMRISMNHPFERRVGIFPAGFDNDGVLFCNQSFADYPMVVPDRKFDPWTEASPRWMLLSFRADATASSSLEGHGPKLAVNEDARSWWVADGPGEGQWLQVDLGETKIAYAVQINLADQALGDLAPGCADLGPVSAEVRGIYPDFEPAIVDLELSFDGSTWTRVHDPRGDDRDAPHRFVTLAEPMRVRHVRITARRLPFDGPFAVSGLRVFGVGNGVGPAAATVCATRSGPTTATLEWDAVAGAHGYNVRYGLAPTKLYNSWMVYDETRLDLRSLNAGSDYWVAVDAFNENGVTAGEPRQVICPHS